MVEVKQLIASTKNKVPGQELQPKEVIATNAQIREHVRQLNEDYKELERLYQKERSKRKVGGRSAGARAPHSYATASIHSTHGTRYTFNASQPRPTQNKQSKFSPEELEVRGQMVQQVLAEIQELKEVSLQGYVRNYQGNRGGLIMPMEESEAFKGPLGACVKALRREAAPASLSAQRLHALNGHCIRYFTVTPQGTCPCRRA